MALETKTGIIIYINHLRGYAFIRSDESGKQIFAHASGMMGIDLDNAKEGALVEYFEVKAPKGPKAIAVVVR